MKTMTLALLASLAITGLARANAAEDSLAGLFGPAVGSEEPADPDFSADWFAAFEATGDMGDLSAIPDEPIVLVSQEARALAAEVAPADPVPAAGPVLPLEPFVALWLNSSPAQRSKAMGLALKPVLKGKQYNGKRDTIRDCADAAGELVGNDVVTDYLYQRPVATPEAAADALVAGVGVCLGSADIKGSQIIAAFVQAISAALARPQ